MTSRVAAPWSARWLERLFTTPVRHRPPERELAWRADARRHHVAMDDGRRLPVDVWGEGPPVLLVHGWAGRGSQLGAFAAPLVAAGYQVVAFDGPAHGEADGDRTALPDFAVAVERMARDLGPLAGVIAHSMGGGATALAVSRGLPVRRLAFLAPACNPGAYLGHVGPRLGFTPAVVARTRRRIEARLGIALDDVHAAIVRPPAPVPLLVVHDADDAEVPAAEGRAIAAGWAGSTLRITRGLGHRRVVRDAAVVAEVVDFLTA
ncbi:MAG: alpha/beta fold hydrolase [bacterium]